MVKINYKDQVLNISDGSSVLETLELAGIDIPTSCRNGVCQTCKMKVLQGRVPKQSQARLKSTEQEAGFFLPCVCYPTEDISIVDINQAPRYETTIISVEQLNHDIAEIKLSVPLNFAYRAGQYIQIIKDSKHIRTYSLASVPEKNEPLTLQVRRIPDGVVSSWLHALTENEKIQISGPFGECFYVNGREMQPLILIGTGSGLSPLYGIVHDALLKGHKGEILLFHGVARHKHLYKEKELRMLAHKFPQFKYFPCLSEEQANNYEHGSVLDVAFQNSLNLKESRVFLSGHPEMVKNGRKKMFLSGISIRDIYADPFG